MRYRLTATYELDATSLGAANAAGRTLGIPGCFALVEHSGWAPVDEDRTGPPAAQVPPATIEPWGAGDHDTEPEGLADVSVPGHAPVKDDARPHVFGSSSFDMGATS